LTMYLTEEMDEPRGLQRPLSHFRTASSLGQKPSCFETMIRDASRQPSIVGASRRERRRPSLRRRAAASGSGESGTSPVTTRLWPVTRRVHVLRRSATVRLLDAGEDIDFAKDHLGHKSIQSTTTYAQISDSRRNRTIRRLEKSRDFSLPT